ncbi:MAG: hypothetical protein KJ749_09930 [Planctomycetes bacterium]|nr:hypothetical protein [Planctomycetota bacterium]
MNELTLETRYRGLPLDEVRRTVHREAVAGVQVAVPRLTDERNLPVRLRLDGAELPRGVEIERPSTPGGTIEASVVPTRRHDRVPQIVSRTRRDRLTHLGLADWPCARL